MCAQKMHADEVDTDVSLVRRLLAAQFPQWADLPIEQVDSAGTVNAIYRLGDNLAVRLPRVERWAADSEREFCWLPKLAPLLPLAVPEPVAMGSPGQGYPLYWAVYRWLEGKDVMVEPISDLDQAASGLARFVAAMQRIDPAAAPRSTRGDLATRDTATRTAIAQLDDIAEPDTAIAAWEASLHAPAWEAAPIWTHGDLLPTNMLVQQGRLTAIIDFGSAGLGDPAFDLLCAWSVLTAATRPIFRSTLSVDDATWLRGRGFALSVAALQYPYYKHTNPVLASNARYVIGQVLADYQQNNEP
jgi:aminoglycoside phosphotransferase (APT) family kinase protein